LHNGIRRVAGDEDVKVAKSRAQGIIPGCTEIGMLISNNDIKEVPLFDTMRLHATKAVQISIGQVRPA
jgi:aspartate/glutamate racemase